MERFIDCYVPIRTSKQIEDCLRSCLSVKQISKLDVYGFSNVKKLNENLVKEEDNSELKSLSLSIL